MLCINYISIVWKEIYIVFPFYANQKFFSCCFWEHTRNALSSSVLCLRITLVSTQGTIGLLGIEPMLISYQASIFQLSYHSGPISVSLVQISNEYHWIWPSWLKIKQNDYTFIFHFFSSAINDKK